MAMQKLGWVRRAAQVSMNDRINTTLLYREVQQFRQPWIWVVLLFSSLAALTAAATPFFVGSSWAQNWILNLILILFGIIFGILFPILFYIAALIAEVRTDGLYISFYPLLFAPILIPFNNIVRCQVRQYHPLREYGGWGIRYGSQGKAYNVSGDRGVQLELANGEKILIGSGNPEALVRAINVFTNL
ncbi:MAG: hypothetical protein F6J93_19140 [Oscillatoria sp. SIO1A7]|nr:hypothetical protein [Oscillatoria sp. SIO1A7]